MLVEEAKKCRFVLVGNIPVDLRSADLRAFFSHLVERGAFACFHFRHRPEHLPVHGGGCSEAQTTANTTTEASDSLKTLAGDDTLPQKSSVGREVSVLSETAGGHETRSSEVKDGRGESGEGSEDTSRETAAASSAPRAVASASRCCVAAVRSEHEPELLLRYSGRHWARPSGALLKRKVKLNRLQVSFDDKKQNESTTGSSQQDIPWSDLCTIPELNPPSVMPHGNVGTPTAVFLGLIHQCKLPGRLIRKLGLEFPKSRSKRRYGAVGLDYGSGEVVGGGGGGGGREEEEEEEEGARKVERESDDRPEEEIEIIPSDDDHDAEEWERYEALHDDVDKQGRTKERLYEEEMEVVWEKGGSGLVFYTDASHWHNLEGDFDEQCSKEDDWDVDTAPYYDPGGGDKEARDMKVMRQEQSIREGAEQASLFAGFERYTKGIGSKVLRRSGWTEGRGVGRAADGRSEPVDTDGQHPHNKTGLGYRGEKLVRHMPQTKKRRRRATRDVIISTVYDRPEEEEETVLRSAPCRTIKYRQPGIQFVAGAPLLQPPASLSSTDSKSS